MGEIIGMGVKEEREEGGIEVRDRERSGRGGGREKR